MTTSMCATLRALTSETMSDALIGRPTAVLVRVTRASTPGFGPWTWAGDARLRGASYPSGGPDHLDFYLLHWRGREDTIGEFADVIRSWGVSDFHLFDLDEPTGPEATGTAAHDVMDALARRGIEFDRPPRFPEHGRPITAFSPIAPRSRTGRPGLPETAGWPGATQAPPAVPWLLTSDGLTAIPTAQLAGG